MTDQDRFDTFSRIERAARDQVVVMTPRRHGKTLLARSISSQLLPPGRPARDVLSMFGALFNRISLRPFCDSAACGSKKTRFRDGE